MGDIRKFPYWKDNQYSSQLHDDYTVTIDLSNNVKDKKRYFFVCYLFDKEAYEKWKDFCSEFPVED
jgi:hypothetical protein